MDEILPQNTFILRRPRVANFPDIIKTTVMFIKTTIKESKQIKKKKKKLCIKMQSIYVFLNLVKVADLLMSAKLKGCVT